MKRGSVQLPLQARPSGHSHFTSLFPSSTNHFIFIRTVLVYIYSQPLSLLSPLSLSIIVHFLTSVSKFKIFNSFSSSSLAPSRFWCLIVDFGVGLVGGRAQWLVAARVVGFDPYGHVQLRRRRIRLS